MSMAAMAANASPSGCLRQPDRHGTMVDVTSISHAMTATKAMKDILEAMVGLRDANTFQTERFKLQSLIIDAQNSIFSANEERSALLERVRDLEKTIAEFETWDTEKQRYELKTI